jgi:hypothetical protein
MTGKEQMTEAYVSHASLRGETPEITANENQQNAQIILSQFVAPTCFGRA